MKFKFSTVYRVTQKDFYAHPYTSMWAPDLRRCIIVAVELITPHMLINTIIIIIIIIIIIYSINPSLCTDTIGCGTCLGGVYSIVKYNHYT
jgi:hypothetical protein